jgi:hypothetical protein
MENNVHPPQEMGACVLINVGWYYRPPAPETIVPMATKPVMH